MSKKITKVLFATSVNTMPKFILIQDIPKKLTLSIVITLAHLTLSIVIKCMLEEDQKPLIL